MDDRGEEHAVYLARCSDLGMVKDLVEAIYRPWVKLLGTRPLPMDADYAELTSRRSVYLTGRPRINGLIVVIPEGYTLLIDNLAVRPELQGRGVGKRLMNFAEARARELGMTGIRLYTHEMLDPNVKLYLRLGYVPTRWVHLRDRTVAHMTKII